MARLLALEWNDAEAHVAVASRHGRRTVIDEAFAIPLDAGPPQPGQAEADVGQQIAEALGARGIAQLDALVAVGRGSVELRQLQLPAATDEELPKMVRLQALLEFNEVDDKWPLDFVPVDQPDKGPCTVLAAAIAPALVERIEEVCRRSGLKARRVVLRSCASAALMARAQAAQKGQVLLLVDVLSDQADLTVAIDGRVLFLRTMRLGDELTRRQSLLAEIRLTMAAAQNQCGGRQVAGIVLCGRGEADAALAQQIQKETRVRTTLLDPFAGWELSDQLRASPPEQPGRFAAVLGMLLVEFDEAAHAIDFLHPRRAVEPTLPYNKWKLAAVAAGVLLLAYLVYGRIAYWRLSSEVEQLEARAAAADRRLAAAGSEKLAAARDIAKWADGEVVWLDQLRELSADFPPANTATINHLYASVLSERPTWRASSAPTSAGGEIRGKVLLEGLARDHAAVIAMEKSLRAHGRPVESGKNDEDRSVPPYSSKFSTTVLIHQGLKP